MKKLFTFLIGLVVGIGATYYYFNSNDSAAFEAVDLNAPPKGVITPKQAIAMDQAFNVKHKLISDSLMKRSDNRSAWWSLDNLESYLTYAKKQTHNLGYTMDGVRVYLGAYPIETDKLGYTTMFLVPTGTENTADGSLLPDFSFQGGSPDIPNGNGLNRGDTGTPPGANYPQ